MYNHMVCFVKEVRKYGNDKKYPEPDWSDVDTDKTQGSLDDYYNKSYSTGRWLPISTFSYHNLSALV